MKKQILQIAITTGLVTSGFAIGKQVTENKYDAIVDAEQKAKSAVTEKWLEAENKQEVTQDKLDQTISVVEKLAYELDEAKQTQVPQTFNNSFNVNKFTISAYSPLDDRNYINSDGTPTTTSTMKYPTYGTFAVDPKVIPYGSTVVIYYPDGTMERGRAEDTGGAIKGNRIDVFRRSFDTAINFGMKDAVVVWYKE